MVFFADIWGLMSSLPLACDSDRCFVVNCLILGRSAEVLSGKAARQNASVVLSKLQNRMSVLFYFSCPDSILSCWGPDYLTVQLTPNNNTFLKGILKYLLRFEIALSFDLAI